MTADDVLDVLGLFRRAGAEVWIGGGWGIDVLVGRQTRDHRDLDLMHRQDQEAVVVAALGEADFELGLDWRPIRFVMAHPDGRELDLHPLRFAADGSAEQTSPDPDRPFRYPAGCFVTGMINNVAVPCLSAEQQVRFHQGYELTERDRHDLDQLRRSFGLET